MSADSGTTPGGAIFNERYEVVAPISSGAMGAVYRAVDLESGGEVAIKRLLDVKHAARFEIEARLLASLSHPRVVKVLDHAGDEEGLYIVMELVRGTDLGAQLKDRGHPGLPPTEAIEYARHACEALQYVHDQQIVHRDVKPQNMILADERRRCSWTSAWRGRSAATRRWGRSRSARRATWPPRCSPAARCRRPATSSAWPPRCGR